MPLQYPIIRRRRRPLVLEPASEQPFSSGPVAVLGAEPALEFARQPEPEREPEQGDLVEMAAPVPVKRPRGRPRRQAEPVEQQAAPARPAPRKWRPGNQNQASA